jgi:RNA polymerase sigma factor (sigma-70 family)
MSSPTPTPEFFDLVQQGDRRATAEFVDRFGPVALAFLRVKFTRLSEAEHDELVQEILVDVIASLPKYDRTRPFKAWFRTITRRRALDFMEQHAGEWMQGEFGQVPTHISYEAAMDPEGPEELQTQIRKATATDAALDVDPEDEESEVDAQAPVGSLTSQLAALRDWMASLSPEQRVLLDHYTLGASWEEVAEQLTRLGDPVSPGTAKVRGHRLKERAKRLLAGGSGES